MTEILRCESLKKTYGVGTLAETALHDVSLSFAAGETCVLLGPSGSGKTTLLSILGCLLQPTSGNVWVNQARVRFHDSRQLTQLRRLRIGFVFQHAQLLPFLSVGENLRIVAKNAGLRRPELSERLNLILSRLGIEKFIHRKPAALSGGQRQRVSIARAVLHRPPIILADEPTASLDWESGQAAMRLLIDQARQDRSLLITVTHDTRLVPSFDRVLHVESGKVSAA